MSPRQSRHTGRQAGQPRPLPDLPGARPRALREGPRQRPTARAPPGLRKRRAARQRRRRPARPSPLSPLDQRAAPVQALRLRPAAAGRRLPAPARAQGCPPTSPAHLTRAALRARTRRLSRRTQDTHLALAHLASHKSSAPHSRAAGGVAQAECRLQICLQARRVHWTSRRCLLGIVALLSSPAPAPGAAAGAGPASSSSAARA